MKNGQPSPIFDIRYFFGDKSPHSYLDDDVITSYGRRLAWYLNSEKISLGAYNSLYILFSPEFADGEIVIDDHQGSNEDWWFNYVRIGVGKNIKINECRREYAFEKTVEALKLLLPNDQEIVDKADRTVRKYGSELRFLVREKEYKRYKLKIGVTIAKPSEPSRLYVTIIDRESGHAGETSPIPVGFHDSAFDDASSIRLKDLEIELSKNGGLQVQWCKEILNSHAVLISEQVGQKSVYYSKKITR